LILNETLYSAILFESSALYSEANACAASPHLVFIVIHGLEPLVFVS